MQGLTKAHRITCLYAGLLTAWCLSAGAADKPVMTWLLLDLPPYTILVDNKPSNGIADVRIKMIIKQWPEAEHHFVVMNTKRIYTSLDEGIDACYGPAIFTPARQQSYYSTATHLALPLHLITRKELLPTLPLDSKGQVLPATLFDRPDLSGVIDASRSFSPLIDALLAKRSANSGITLVTSAQKYGNLLQMVAANHGDYTLEYETVFRYQQKLGGNRPFDTLLSLPIAGGKLSPTGFLCPHTSWGLAAIQKIDRIVTSLALDPEFQETFSEWISPETRKFYQAEMDAFFLQRAKPSDPKKFLPH